MRDDGHRGAYCVLRGVQGVDTRPSGVSEAEKDAQVSVGGEMTQIGEFVRELQVERIDEPATVKEPQQPLVKEPEREPAAVPA